MRVVEFHRLADRDYNQAIEYFRKHGIKPLSQFTKAVDLTVESIRLQPLVGSPFRKSFRFMKVKGYRYTIYYQHQWDQPTIVYAVAHDRRKPGYWLRRAKK